MQEQGKADKPSLLNAADRVIGNVYARLQKRADQDLLRPARNIPQLHNSVWKHPHSYKLRTSASANSISSRDGTAFTSFIAAILLCSLL